MTDHLLSDRDLDLIFRDARSYNSWTDQPVTNVELQAVYDLMRMGPTSANCQPARLVFCQSKEARQTLADCADEGNREKIRTAPVTAIIGMDMEFYEKLPKTFPHTDARSWFMDDDGNPLTGKVEETAFRNSALQGAYLIVAARAVGLDCGPMSGFDAKKVEAAFFAGTPVKANFICALGHGSGDDLFPRSPRLPFDEACEIQ
ncbi:MAG: malonic semialdehyde reductase [Pacificimonas sp.]|jgi:nitroreductase|nr:malonic semialdehyde reductase [Pacificimonas sp.]